MISLAEQCESGVVSGTTVMVRSDGTGDLWYPPQQEGCAPWVNVPPGESPDLPPGTLIHCLWSYERDDRQWLQCCGGMFPFDAERWHDGRVAYCIRLDQPAKSEEPAKAAAVDANEPMKQRDALQQAVTTPAKDEGWREYDPKYPPIQPYPMEFRVAESEKGQRHYYRRTDSPESNPYGLSLLHEHRADRFGRFGRWGA